MAGLPHTILIADAMAKTAGVRLAQIEANTLGGMAIKVVGEVGAVRAAFEAGDALARSLDARVAALLNPRYEDSAWFMVDSRQKISRLLGSRNSLIPLDAEPADFALGLIETRGLVPAIAAADAMCKAANVTIVSKEKIGAARVSILVRGDVAAVEAAIEAGKAEAGRVGKVNSAHVIARPDAVIRRLFP